MRALDKINFKINGEINDPSNINFDILGFHKKRTFIHGELILVEYFRNYDGVTYSNKILEENRDYVKDDTTKVVISRNTTINYLLEDDEIGLTKSWITYYSGQEGIQEGINRRNNIINDSKSYLLETIGEENSFDFLLEVKNQLEYYINGYQIPLINIINSTIKPYITQDIKNVLINKITYV